MNSSQLLCQQSPYGFPYHQALVPCVFEFSKACTYCYVNDAKLLVVTVAVLSCHFMGASVRIDTDAS